jgi:hypothetical protein
VDDPVFIAAVAVAGMAVVLVLSLVVAVVWWCSPGGGWSGGAVVWVVLWWSGGMWQLPNFVAAGLRHGWTLDGVYRKSEHELSAYAQTDDWRQSTRVPIHVKILDTE